MRTPRRPPVLCPMLAATAALLAVVVLCGHASAQGAMPFGVGRPDATMGGPPSGLGAWILAQQSEFYRHLSAAIRASKADGSAAWGLMGLSLAYGVFHAAGPGHGKAVISAYLFASGDTLRKGVLLAFVSALVQAIAAVALVAVLALAIGATARQMDDVALLLERLSYGLIACVGALLVYRKGAALWTIVAPRLGIASPALVHVHGPDCSHAPILPPGGEERIGFRGAVGAVLAVGIRPCTGAIIVLVFSLAQGLFLAGIAATFAMALGTALTVAAIACLSVAAKGVAVRLAAPGHAAAAIALRTAELAIALAVLALGLTLLAGLAAPIGQA